jgi:hypothetical protein
MDLQDQEVPTYETAPEAAGSQIDIGINVSPEEGSRFGRGSAADFVVFNQVSSPFLVLTVSAFVLLSSTDVRSCAHLNTCNACPGDLPIQSILPQEGKS